MPCLRAGHGNPRATALGTAVLRWTRRSRSTGPAQPVGCCSGAAGATRRSRTDGFKVPSTGRKPGIKYTTLHLTTNAQINRSLVRDITRVPHTCRHLCATFAPTQRIRHYGGRYSPGGPLALRSSSQAARRYPTRTFESCMTRIGIRFCVDGLPTMPLTVVFHYQSVTSTVARQLRPPTGEQPVGPARA